MDVFDDSVEPDATCWHGRVRDAHRQDGYRRGLDAGHEATLQRGFNDGYRLAADVTRALSSLRGVLTAIRGDELTEDTGRVPPGRGEEIETIIQQLSEAETEAKQLLEGIFKQLSEGPAGHESCDTGNQLKNQLDIEQQLSLRSESQQLPENVTRENQDESKQPAAVHEAAEEKSAEAACSGSPGGDCCRGGFTGQAHRSHNAPPPDKPDCTREAECLAVATCDQALCHGEFTRHHQVLVDRAKNMIRDLGMGQVLEDLENSHWLT